MSELKHNEFQDAVNGSFTTYWAARTPIAYANKTFDPAEEVGDEDDAAWVRLALVGSDDGGQQRFSNSVDRNHFSRNGRVVVEIYVRQGTSNQRAYTLAEDVLTWMENPVPGVANTVLSNLTAPVEIGSDGTWYQVTVTADWVYYTDKAA